MCPAATNPKDEMKAFIDVAARPIAARLNSAAPGANLNPQDAYAIMHLCPFETVAKGELSPFCSLFSKEDFEIYEYAGDLEKFYNTGYASRFRSIVTTRPIVRSSGMGVLWELSKASDILTNSSGVSRIPPHTTVYKQTVPYFLPPRPSHWIWRCTSISRMTT